MKSKTYKDFLGSGWSFPITFSGGSNTVKMTKYEANINETIDIILKTNLGERLMDDEFGSGLQRFFFRSMDETLKSEIRETVKSSLLTNEPRITVQNVIVEFSEKNEGLVNIMVEYIFNQVNTRHNYVIPFHLNEGTNLNKI